MPYNRVIQQPMFAQWTATSWYWQSGFSIHLAYRSSGLVSEPEKSTVTFQSMSCIPTLVHQISRATPLPQLNWVRYNFSVPSSWQEDCPGPLGQFTRPHARTQ
jgi:hypothetical protein